VRRPRYPARLFEPTGYCVLRRPEQLPAAIVEVVRQVVQT
jgi:hypothetical protein